MDLTIHKNDLARVLSRAASVAAAKSPISALTTVLVDARDGRLRACGTDLYRGIETSAPANIKTPGAIAVDAKRAAEIAKALPSGEVRIRLVKTQAEVTAGRSKFKLSFLPAKDFPPIPRLNADAPRTIVSARELSRAIAQGAYAMMSDDTRPHLCGALFETEGPSLRVVSTDGNRLAIGEVAADGPALSVLMPNAAVAEIRKLAESQKEGTIGIAIDGNTVFFVADDAVLSAKMSDAAFPPYRKLGVTPQHTVTVHRENVIDAMKRVGITAERGPVILSFSEGVLKIATESGEGEDSVDCDATVSMRIKVAHAFVVEAIAAIHDDEVKLGLTNELGAFMVTPAASRECSAIVMPMRQ